MSGGLRREIGLLGLTAYGVGTILGAGIYALIGSAAGIAGNSVWMSFLLGAFISSFTGLSYAELSSMIPKSAAEYSYLQDPHDYRKATPHTAPGATLLRTNGNPISNRCHSLKHLHTFHRNNNSKNLNKNKG